MKKYSIIGFTGTQEKITSQQHKIIEKIFALPNIKEIHHGDCIGSDTNIHDIYRNVNKNGKIIIHPPNFDKKRAYNHGDVINKPYPYLTRNRHIVNESDILLACPKEQHEVKRSGTWATIRYAKKLGKKIYIIYPDGSHETF